MHGLIGVPLQVRFPQRRPTPWPWPCPTKTPLGRRAARSGSTPPARSPSGGFWVEDLGQKLLRDWILILNFLAHVILTLLCTFWTKLLRQRELMGAKIGAICHIVTLLVHHPAFRVDDQIDTIGLVRCPLLEAKAIVGQRHHHEVAHQQTPLHACCSCPGAGGAGLVLLANIIPKFNEMPEESGIFRDWELDNVWFRRLSLEICHVFG
mmetsp:Transcript_18950/g.41703  ORF Transcript_18950/g.41703 Transcript_18950/m.41703 type:complete len:208 (-) Transcript_18950:438-1061(-)